ncbi:unnamed protein product [Musa acuminata subsp. malaccensis]|uniref:(wild Malaysian banana) hypothetical protein n=1 Tax=Musa acuminata subsp. malaccensis TaxID=214687 RepID=A0A804JUY7_MUSAM|nr:unnamed protein product [Musa acuminata subsp. malaccensis]
MGGLCSSQSTAKEGESAVIAVHSAAVIAVHSAGEWAPKWQSHTQSDKLMIIDFAASWCGPCRSIEPAIKEMSARFTNAVFLKVDVDDLPEVPTFVLVKRGQEVGRIVGTKKDKLQRTIQRHLNM